ncbi:MULTISPECIES: tetratricopeptide repeat protein [unclassified Nodularia (in: cyanobacteria)]|uniref:tetratricopeptide repeat protein n=1 Tax=unclassified Nodularia (in: cyanobacteria) TaxID=2656917 RepID=UPI00187F91DC|nr:MULTISPECIES: tetratricopeptide repeat protein [unclassified Nodularia (in: cyanobacteria)]MBE9201686.1 tetratricopeptide repeat protein [Nodularia sp. LEGE 06071]MCC2691286.1 tetratricopeptide repeat protein [Nodularia sp. LEGE 04288]
MLKDAQGLVVTTDSAPAIAAINHFIDQALCYGKDAETAILQAIEADPTCALAHAYAAAYYLTQENTKAWQQAQPYLQVLQGNLAKITARERLYVRAILAWANKDIDIAIALHEEITDQFPRDLISVQQGQYHYFYTGNQEKLLEIAQKVLPSNPQRDYLYGMVAFGLEQCHQLKAAEKMVHQAIALNRDDPWAHHAISHVMETQGRADEGIAWMESFADTWENCNSMLYTHNWWHIALYYCQLKNYRKVLKIYDTHIWERANKQSPKDQVGAISILLRLELRGVNVGNRWQEISPYLYSRIDEHALPFQDLHYVYALAKAGHNHWVKEMLQSMQYHALTINPFLRRSWLEIAIPAARGMVAHAQGDVKTTVAELKPVLSRLHEVGGSHAQRVLFEQVYQDAVLWTQKQNQLYAVTA